MCVCVGGGDVCVGVSVCMRVCVSVCVCLRACLLLLTHICIVRICPLAVVWRGTMPLSLHMDR